MQRTGSRPPPCWKKPVRFTGHESCQAQIGVEQNNLMKTCTIVTAIFLPLTLIVGWYGMNLKTPEFSRHLGYTFVVALCVLVCLIRLIVFQKKKGLK